MFSNLKITIFVLEWFESKLVRGRHKRTVLENKMVHSPQTHDQAFTAEFFGQLYGCEESRLVIHLKRTCNNSSNRITTNDCDRPSTTARYVTYHMYHTVWYGPYRMVPVSGTRNRRVGVRVRRTLSGTFISRNRYQSLKIYFLDKSNSLFC